MFAAGSVPRPVRPQVVWRSLVNSRPATSVCLTAPVSNCDVSVVTLVRILFSWSLPVRMLRAVRFAAKLDFQIETATAEPVSRLAPLLRDIPAPRLFDEVLAVLQTWNAEHGTAILLVEQHVDRALDVAHRALLIRNGVVVTDESAAEVRARPDRWTLF